MYTDKCICIRRLNDYDFVLYCKHLWTNVCGLTYMQNNTYGLRNIRYIHDMDMLIMYTMLWTQHYTWTYMTEYRIGMAWYGLDWILCYTIRRHTRMMVVWWFVVYLCIGLMFYVCLNVGYTCMYCCCNTITLHCMIYNWNCIIGILWLYCILMCNLE